MELKGSVSLVTGAAKRVGKAIALELARAGSHIALHYNRSLPEARQAQSEMKAQGVQCRIYSADLNQPAACRELARRVLADFKRCDVLVNSAANFIRKPLQEAEAEDYDSSYKLNLRAPALLIKAIGLENHRNKRPSRIVNIADVGGMLAWDGYLPYTLSKAGIIQLTRSTARALAPWVLVNCIAPGPILMPDKHTAAHLKSSLERTLLKRLGGPQEIARTVRFLAESDFITGITLPVDGGRMLAN